MCHKILLVGLVLFTLLSGLDSSTPKETKGSGEACHDNWRLRKCIRKELRGKCERKSVAKNCQKTCGLCAGMCPAYDYTPYKGCGRTPKSSRIIGGDDVSPHSIPWQVGLLYYSGQSGWSSVRCGGTLLTDQHVLTAAHRTFDWDDPIEASDIQVVVAEHNQNDDVDGMPHEIRSYTNHPQYSVAALYDYDFSIFHLTTPVKFGDRAVPACLPDLRFSEDKLVGKYLTVSGWGWMANYRGSEPDLLQSVDLPVVSQHDCRKAYLNSPFSLEITNSMICAGDLTRKIDSCKGDSGGPLTYKENGRSYLIGVVSFGEGDCANTEFPGVYSRVTTVLDWIHKELRSTC